MKLTGYDSVCSWGVAVACSFVTCMAVLPLKVSGMLFVAFLSRYDTDRQSASLFVVIHALFTCCSSPLIGYLGEIIEMRNLIILGCLFNSLGVGICFFAENIITVTISIGFLCGIGLSLQLGLIPQIIKQHFIKSFSSAYGVTWIGSGAGSFVVIPMIQLLLDVYGVSGALLIACGIILNSVPVAMLLRDPKHEETSLCAKQPNEKEQIVCKKTIKEKKGMFNSDHDEDVLTSNTVSKTHETYAEVKPGVTLNANVTAETETGDTYQNTVSCHEPSMEGHRHPNASAPFHSSVDKKYNIEIHHKPSLTIETRNKYKIALNTLAIFRNPPYLVIVLSMSTYCYIDIFVSTIIIDVSRDKGISHSREQFLLMLLSVAQMVGYACLGCVTDKGYLTASKFLAIGFLCLGLSCVSCIFSNSFSTMMVSVACFGLCISMYTTGSVSLVYEYVEEAKQSMAITSRLVLHAPLIFTMGPILNYFRGTLGSYDGVLYLLAALCATCSALLLLLPCIARCANRKK